jgi:hypothetical protein
MRELAELSDVTTTVIAKLYATASTAPARGW